MAKACKRVVLRSPKPDVKMRKALHNAVIVVASILASVPAFVRDYSIRDPIRCLIFEESATD
jgi:hypothetical protein